MMMSVAGLVKIVSVVVLAGLAGLGDSGPIPARYKRGASVYPVFPSGHYTPPTFYTSNDPSSFISYLGGSGSTTNRRSGQATSASSYSATSVPAMMTYGSSSGSGTSNYTPGSSSANNALDSNVLNSYMLSSGHSGGGSGSSGSGAGSSSSGWSPSSSYGYSGGFYTTDFGHLMPNFAHMPSSSTPSYSRPHLPTLSANSLLHSATTSFNAQNHLYDALLAGAPRPQSYKGSGGY